MEIVEFIATLDKMHFSLSVEKDKLLLQGDKKKLSAEELQAIKNNHFVINYIKQHKQDLIAHLSNGAKNFLPESKAKNISSIYHLSGLQQGMLFHSLYDTGSLAYINQFSCDFLNLDTTVFEKTWNVLLKHHTILRSAFYYDAFSVPVQCVNEETTLPIEILDLRQVATKEQEQALRDYEEADYAKGFDFKTAPLMRVGLLQLSNERFRMLWTFHHILFDGWSLPVLMEEFLATYDLLASGKEIAFRKEDRYEDYIRYIERLDKEQEESYWRNYLKDLDQATLLPFINKTTNRTKGVGSYKIVSLQLNEAISAKAVEFAQRNRITVNTIMQGVWSFLLHQYTGSKNVAFGVIVSGRPDDLPGVELRVGLFINTLPLLSNIEGKQNVITWLQGLQGEQVASRQYQYTPLLKLQEWTEVQGNLFDSVLVFENYPVGKLLSKGKWGLEVENLKMHEHNNYPLSIEIGSAENIRISFNYNTALLDEVYVKGIRDHFEQVVLQIIGNDEVMLQELTLLTPQSEQQLLEKFMGNKSDYPKSKSIVTLFEEQAVISPENIAVRFEDEQLTYRELNERSNQLANYIKSKGVSDETLVPICIERSAELIIGIIAILKAGAAYVPIDPGYPLDRINFMLHDIGAKMMMSNKDSRTKLFLEGDIDIIEIDSDWGYISECSLSNLHGNAKADQLAYVIYTSGSTGTPKGVLVTHRNVVSLVKGIDYVSLTSDDILLSTGSPSFDAATFEYWGMLLNGGQLILCAENKLLHSDFLKEKIGQWAVTKMWFTSSWFNQLVETDITVFNSLKTILVGGEKLSEKHIEKVRLAYPNLEIINGYGPTENTTFSLTYNISGYDIDLIPIGRPLNNRSAYIVDEVGRLMPTGVSGEIWLGGEGISKGYLNQPELTGQKFIKNLFNENDGSRLYKTGDLGRLLPDGNIEYLGRIDEQVKIRGYRIELGEIENVLLQSGLISQAVVVANEDTNGNKRLVGYIVTEEVFDRQTISNYLINKLPEYMVPALWVQLESLPLTPNGKIDKKALPDPEIGEQLSNQYTAPRNKIEEQIAEIWQELLEVDWVGIHDDFFELGGHSLLAIRLISALRRKLEIELAINVVFEYPTIAQLSDILQQQTPQLLTPSIKVQPRSANIPLSFSQERLWFLDRLEGSVQYHVPLILRLKGTLNIGALAFAINNIIDRHEVLRTVFREHGGQVHQVVKDKKQVELELFTFQKDDQENVHQFIQKIISKPFDLSEDNMLRASVVELNDKEHLLVVTLHHIASDAWSMPIMFKEIAELYTSYIEVRADRLVPLPIQYADYAIWQRNLLDENVLGSKLKYWKDKLEGVETLNLPTDYTRPLLKSSAGAWTSFNVDTEIAKKLKILGNEQGTTLFITLLAAFKVLLHRYSGQEDICVGSPIANRGQQEVEGLIGFFLNTLAFRSEVKPGSSFIDLLQQVRATALQAYEHQEVPFEKVVDAVVKERDLSRNPLFQVMFVLLNASKNAAIKVGDLQLSWEEPDRTTSQFDLNFSLTETSEGLKGVVEYSTDLYKESTIERMIAHFNELLHSIVKSPNQNIGELVILPLAEENLLLNEFNNTAADYPKGKRIIQLFEDQVGKTPQAIAVVFEEEELSYEELNDNANRLAHYLQQRGVVQQTLVPICIERGMGMITGVLAILKAGGVYVPIDPEYPAERISYMLEDTGATIIVSNKESSTKLPAKEGLQVIETDTEWEAIQNKSGDNLAITASPNQLVYMLYTSGSTGRPKGVKMPDCGMVNLLSWQEDQFANKSRRVLQFASLNFDVSFQEIFSTLCFGSTLCLISGERRRDVAEVAKDIERYSLTHLFIPYIVFKTLAEYAASQHIAINSLEEIIVAGEQLKLTEDIEAFVRHSGVKLVNQYGPTEAHVVSSYTVDINNLTLLPPIGKPVSNTSLYILARNKELVPVGVVGELYIGGVQVAMGYLNQEALTTEKFIPDPFSKEEDARLYKTGDLARWLADGNLEYLGRMDDQVKIRGFRIELGEVESVLQQSEMVRQAVVLAKEDIHGSKRLVSYIVSEGIFKREVLIEYAKSRLPDYMVPALWVEMDSLPVTRNGKIDKRALPEPDSAELAGTEFIAPRNSTETALAEIWHYLLGVERIGVNDNFFQIGGHSLLATRTVSAIRLQLKVELSIRDLFLYPTIAELSNHVSTLQTGSLLPAIVKAPRPSHIPLSFSQERLWFTDKLEGSVEYHISSGLRLNGLLSFDALKYSLQSIINRHEVLRTVFYEYEGVPYQSVKEKGGFKITLIDGTSYKEDQHGLKKLIQELVKKPYDLRKNFMLRSSLIRLGDQEHILLITLHHIAADAWSMPILVQEVLALYKTYPVETQPLLPVLDLQYADYAIWQRNCLKGKDFESKLNYWKQKLTGVPSLQLPTDHIRPVTRSSRGASLKFSIDKELSGQINELSQKNGSSLYMTLLAAFNVLLHRYSSQEDICVGASIANRTQHEIEGLIGFFVNTLAFRNKVDSNATFLDLLSQVKVTSLEAYEHQEVPFEKVVEAVLNERDTGRTPIFQVMLVLLNTAEIPILKVNELHVTGEPLTSNVSKFDLTLFFTETLEGLLGSVDYSTDLYKEESILRMLSHFKVLLGSIVQDPSQKVGLLQLLTPDEKQKLLTGSNDSIVSFPKDKNIVGLFEELVVRTPNAVALVFERDQLTYRELNARANQLAHYLKSKGVKEDTLVPMCIDRSLAMIIAIIGIMKAGGAYVPIDTDFPTERIAYMLDDCKATIAITSEGSRSRIESASDYIEIIEAEDLMVQMQSTENPSSPVRPNHLAYVIYTSGSTGNPKGVMIEHRNLVDYVFGLEDKIQVSKCNSYALVSTIATDLGNTVIYSSLVFGGALHLFTKEAVSNVEYLHEYFNVHVIDCLKIVPSHWKALCNDESLLLPKKLLIFGGEALQAQMIDDIKLSNDDCRIINHYGPSETTIGKLLHPVNFHVDYNNTIPIGKPFSNTRVYILSNDLELCPEGIPGQLYIAGEGVARGYFNNDELTRTKFIRDPFGEYSVSVMYATGDVVKYNTQGDIEFIGRVDDQVKIRGFRVELGEIESILQQCEEVSQAVVLAREDKQGNKKLVGYIVPTEGNFEKEVILAYLKNKLPAYMIPSTLVELASLPLTANGKIDRKALPDPNAEEALINLYVAPANETETRLAEIWQVILEVEPIGVNDDFFELGGHSLLAVRLVSAIRKSFEVEIPISHIFDYPTVALLANELDAKNDFVLLPPVTAIRPRPEKIPLSFSQERIWFIDEMERSVQYHVPSVLKLTGKIDVGAFEYALRIVVNRHQVLRSVFKEEDGQPFQHVIDDHLWNLTKTDGSVFKNQQELNQYIQQVILKPFNLSKDYMLRAELIRLGDEENVLVLTLHHIASDGWSRGIMVKEIVESYQAHINNSNPLLLSLPVQYSDYAMWQRNYLSGEVLDKKVEYWKENLAGVQTLQLPTDFERPKVQSLRGAMINNVINKQVSDRLQTLSISNNSTLFMTLLSSFNLLLHRYSQQDDICIGSPIAGRQQQELEGLIGFFVNTLAFRTKIDSNATFIELLQQVKSSTLKAYEHQEAPFEKVVEAVVKERDLSRSPLFQVMFVLRNTPEVPEINLGGVQLSNTSYEHTTALFDMTFFMTETPNGIHLAVEYSTDLFTEATVKRMIAHFQQLLTSIVNSPKQAVGKLQMLNKAEEHQLLEDNNETDEPFQTDITVAELFEQQVTETPQATALIFEGKELTYHQLNEQANQLAHYLRAKGLQPDSLVPVCMERGMDMIVSVLAIIKAGGAYVPIDPDYPEERISYMLQEINASLILTSQQSKNLLNNTSAELIIVDRLQEQLSNQQTENLANNTLPQNLVYVLYTSGSTGRPKGVKMPMSAMVNLLHWQQQQFDKNHRTVLQFASLSFDVSFQEIFSTLCFGNTLCLISAERRKDAEEIIADIQQYGITHLFLPYIVFKTIAGQLIQDSQKATTLQQVIVAGEQLKLTEEIQQYLQQSQVTLINQYGPTEAHVVSSYIINTKEPLPLLPPIGKPIANTRLYILDDYMQPVPQGVAGGLYIGGVQVARGYLNQPELTKEKFISDPFAHKEGARLYHTGDLAKWLADGNIEYLGRKDDQVKIRGFRIELGEVESVIQQSPLVSQVAVLAKSDSNGNKRLVSYVVTKEAFDREALVSYAKTKLPDYMVPSLWVPMESLPVNKNGKIDRKNLPDPDAGEMLQNEYVAPRNETEQAIAGIWQSLLGVEKTGIHDNFFEAGGHSLLATRVVSAIRKQLNAELSIRDLFLYPTVAELVGVIAEKEQQNQEQLPPITKAERTDNIPLSFSQERLWFIDRLEGSTQYHISPILRLEGKLDVTALEHAIKTIVHRHEVLRTVFIEKEGNAWQIIKESTNWKLDIINIKKNDLKQAEAGNETLELKIAELIGQPFNLAKDYMLRATLIGWAADRHVLIVTMHHIASDAWSMPIIVKEVIELYSAYTENRQANLPILPLQYVDYAIWQRNYLQGELLEKKLQYWKDKLQGISPLQLPTDYPRPAVRSGRGASETFSIDKDILSSLQKISDRHGVTLFMTLFSAFKVLVYRYSGQNDVCVGTPIANRPFHELNELAGFFLNMLAIRDVINENETFGVLLKQVKTSLLEAYENQDVPFEKVVGEIVKDRTGGRDPLFQLVFVFHNKPQQNNVALPGIALLPQQHAQTTAKYELTFTVTETASGLQLSVEYSTDLYEQGTIQRMLGHFTNLLTLIVGEPGKSIGALQIMDEEERNLVVSTFNQTAKNLPLQKTIIDLFYDQVQKTPDAVAVVFDDKQLTFKQLDDQSNQLAHYLLKDGVRSQTPVPVCLQRSLDMIIGIMGILKAGGAYVPIDPEYPDERKQYMLNDIGAGFVLTNAESRAQVPVLQNVMLFDLDELRSEVNNQSCGGLQPAVLPEHLAYIIYTSGSTGQPKGAMNQHGALANRLLWAQDYFGLTSGDVVLQKTTFSFDVSVWELLWPLVAGAKLVFAKPGGQKDNDYLKEIIEEEGVTMLHFVPSMLGIFLADLQKGECNSLQKVLCSGEALKPSQVNLFREKLPQTALHNLYGPTEAAIDVTCWSVPPTAEEIKVVPIGKPVANTQIYIVDAHNRPVPVGIAGELHIGGVQVGRGYWNRPELTAEKFITDPFSSRQGARLYKTGDLCRWLHDGNIEYLGRIDEQVKIRGFRIELGEIESELMQSGLVSSAVVVAKENALGNRWLVGYVVSDEAVETKALSNYLYGKLPEYMVPALWVKLDSLPLTPSGKIDRKALPDTGGLTQLKKEYVAPRNELETALTELWQELLGVERVGIHDNFFELGGHSLMIMRMVSHIKKKFSFVIPIAVLFQFSSIADLSNYLEWQKNENVEENEKEEDTTLYEVINI